MGISYGISKMVKGNPTLSLILAGMAIASLFGAFLSLMKYVADPINQLPAITYWLMGSLASVGMQRAAYSPMPMLVGIAILILIRWRFNVLAMGEEEAMALGVNTGATARHNHRLLHHDYSILGVYQRHHRLGGAGHPPYRPRAGRAEP